MVIAFGVLPLLHPYGLDGNCVLGLLPRVIPTGFDGRWIWFCYDVSSLTGFNGSCISGFVTDVHPSGYRYHYSLMNNKCRRHIISVKKFNLKLFKKQFVFVEKCFLL